MRARISPASERSTASGLIRIRVRSTATARAILLGAPPPGGLPGVAEVDRGGRLDARLAIRADLPERLERLLAVHAGLLELGRADRADEVRRVDLGPADGAVEVAEREPLLHRLDLELALADVLEILRGPEEHVDDRPDEGRDRAEDRRHPYHPGVLDPPAGILVDPVRRRHPEDDEKEERKVPADGDEVRVEVHRSSFPTRYPTPNAAPTIAMSTNAANATTVSCSPSFVTLRAAPLARPNPRGGRGSPSRARGDPASHARPRRQGPRRLRPRGTNGRPGPRARLRGVPGRSTTSSRRSAFRLARGARASPPRPCHGGSRRRR